MCVAVQGNQRLQLVRQLTAAALNLASDGAPFAAFAACNAVCTDASATTTALANCIDTTDAYNNSGDGETAPFDPAGAADTAPCTSAMRTPCTLLQPSACAAP
jgi:hypothetical protein